MNIPLLDIKALHAPIAAQLEEAVLRVLRSGVYINGEDVTLLEAELTAYVQSSHAVAVSSGTDALLAALMALDVRPGDRVITTSYSFFATAGAIARLGAVPVFVDIDENGFNIDVTQLEAAVTKNTVGMIPVHLFGAPASMKEIMSIARAHDLWVVEDTAQALGSRMSFQGESRVAGTIGTAGIYSFFPAKNMGAAGDAGAVVTSDGALAERIRRIRGHGAMPKYHHQLVGGNFRMDTLQAALLRVKLPYIETWNNARRLAAARYDELLKPVRGIVCPPAWGDAPHGVSHPSDARHVYNQYVIRFENREMRDTAQATLRRHQIDCAVYYPVPLHLQPCFAQLGYRTGSLPHSETAAETSLALPIHPTIHPDDQQLVVDALVEALSTR